MDGLGGIPWQAMGQEWANRGSGLGQFFGGLFGNSDKPYKKAAGEYGNYFNKGIAGYQPFYDAGQRGMGNYENFLNQMQNPQAYYDKIMGGYQQSPWARYMQQQGNRSATNAASANGLSGSTPMAQFMAQQSEGIASQDMQNYLNSIFGLGNEYLQGQGNLMGQGWNAANAMGNMYGNAAEWFGQNAYNREAAKQRDKSNIVGGLTHFIFG